MKAHTIQEERKPHKLLFNPKTGNPICKFTETINPLFGDPMWTISEIDLSKNGIKYLVKAFLKKYYKEDFELSIFDNEAEASPEYAFTNIEIECTKEDIPTVVNEIYKTQGGKNLSFIGVNSATNCIVIGMSLTKRKMNNYFYSYKNGEFQSIDFFA